MNTLEWAIEYVRRGWSVIPLRANGKEPAIPWDRYQAERPTEQMITAWFRGNNRNIGIVTGAVSSIVVLDVDAPSKPDEPDGRESLDKLIARFGPLPETAVSLTGSGGRHIIFKHPGFELRNFSKKKRTGLDFRGDGGYIVSPPSIHPNGNAYEWLDDVEPAEMPDWLKELCADGPEPEWFTELFPPPQKKASNQKKAKAEVVAGAGPAETILENCAFCQHCRDNAATLSEPEWYAMITNIGRAAGGRELVHELSRPYPGYSPHETDRKLDHALQDGEPHTCAYIQDNLGFTGCPAGGCGVKAPIGFVTDSLLVAKVTVDSAIRRLREEPRREVVYDEEVVGALAVLRNRDAAEYAKVKGEIRDICGKLINFNDLERAVRQKQAAMNNLRIAQPGEQQPPIKADWLQNRPFDFEIRRFGDWNISEEGIAKVVFDENGSRLIEVCSAPVFISRRLKRVDSGLDEARVELAWWRDGEWQRTIVDADVAFTASKATILRKQDVPINSETAKLFVTYLAEFERAYIREIPLVKTVSRMGWYGSKHFFPGLEGDYIVDNADMVRQLSGFHPSGELEDWVKFIAPVRQYPIARFMLACAFAAPLMRLVNQRIFIFHAYGRSRGGKTAALVAALSVWGRPEDIIANFNTTKVGLETIAGFYNDLPLGLDEQQIASRNQSFIESLVYMLSMGKGRTRGSKGGGLREYQQWKTIVLTTGEDPLSTDASTAGVKSRALEVYGAPIPDELAAQRVHRGISANYGTAGPAFIRRLMDELAKNPRMVLEDYERLLDMLQERFSENLSSHVSAVTIGMLADFYASQWIFGQGEEKSFLEAVQMGEEILAQLERSAETDDSLRAYDYLMSWCDTNAAAFSQRIQSIWYGFATEDYYFIFPVVFDKALRDGGFSPKRILKDWAMLGVIKTENRGDKDRYRVREYVNMTYDEERPRRERKYFIAVKRTVQYGATGATTGPQIFE